MYVFFAYPRTQRADALRLAQKMDKLLPRHLQRKLKDNTISERSPVLGAGTWVAGRDIAGGEDWLYEAKRAIQLSNVVVFCVGPAQENSRLQEEEDEIRTRVLQEEATLIAVRTSRSGSLSELIRDAEPIMEVDLSQGWSPTRLGIIASAITKGLLKHEST